MGPLLFNIFVNDMFELASWMHMQMTQPSLQMELKLHLITLHLIGIKLIIGWLKIEWFLMLTEHI